MPVESNRTQAEVPRGAVILPNRWGSASGLWLEDPARGLVVLLPGVPLEMRNLMEHEVVPRFRQRVAGRVIRSRTLRTVGVAEAALAEQLGEIERDIAPVTLAYLPQAAGVDLRLTVWDVPASQADALLAAAAARVTSHAGNAVYGSEQDDLAAVVLEAARRRSMTIALAESCTGGLVGARLTEIAGSSDVLLGSAVCYSYASKTDVLGVPAEIIAEQGAVSEAVVRLMAEGALRRFGGGHRALLGAQRVRAARHRRLPGPWAPGSGVRRLPGSPVRVGAPRRSPSAPYGSPRRWMGTYVPHAPCSSEPGRRCVSAPPRRRCGSSSTACGSLRARR